MTDERLRGPECPDRRGFKSSYPHLTDEPCATCDGEGVTAVWNGKAIGTCSACGGSGVATTEGEN